MAADTEASMVRYALDAGRSTFRAQAFATGLLAGFGHNPTIAITTFSGEARFAAATLADASLRIVVDTSSLTLVDDVKEKDRQEIEQTMRRDVLDVAAYPEAVFQSTSIAPTRVAEGRYKARIVGDLTLHGTTRTGLWILAQLTASGDELRAQGAFTLRQTDYGIKPVSFAAGALKIKDGVELTFDLIGHTAPNGA